MSSNSDKQELVYLIGFSVYLLIKATGIIPHEIMIAITIGHRLIKWYWPSATTEDNGKEETDGPPKIVDEIDVFLSIWNEISKYVKDVW